MVRIFFIYMDTQDHTIYCVWINFIAISLYPRREEKHLVLAGIELRSSCFSSDRSNHLTMAPRVTSANLISYFPLHSEKMVCNETVIT